MCVMQNLFGCMNEGGFTALQGKADVPSQREGLQHLFQEDMEEDEHRVALTGDTCFLLEYCIKSERDCIPVASYLCL